MNFKIAVCDDEQTQAELLAVIVQKWSGRFSHACEIRTFPSAEAFLFAYEDDSAYDILLLDVEMRDISGIDLAKKIRHDSSRAEIVFITSHFEFYGEGYDVDALHYLIKPVDEEKLMAVLTKAAEKLSAEPPSVILTCDGETVKVYETDIVYVESDLHYIAVHTKDKEYKIKENISSFAEKLSGDFYRAHRSYLVSLKHIVKITKKSVFVDIGEELPLSRGKYDDINRAFIERN